MKLKLKATLHNNELSIEVLEQEDFANISATIGNKSGLHSAAHIRSVSHPAIVFYEDTALSMLYVKGVTGDNAAKPYQFASASVALLYLSFIIYALEANGFTVSVELSGDITV